MDSSHLIAWLAIEANGTNPRHSPIVEVSMVITETALLEEVTALSLIINPKKSAQWGSNWIPEPGMSGPVKREVGFGVSLKTADESMVETIERVDGQEKFISICADPAILPFIEHQLPHLYSMLTVTLNFDFESLVRSFKMAGRYDILEAPPIRSKRLITKLQVKVSEARYLVHLINSIPPEEAFQEGTTIMPIKAQYLTDGCRIVMPGHGIVTLTSVHPEPELTRLFFESDLLPKPNTVGVRLGSNTEFETLS